MARKNQLSNLHFHDQTTIISKPDTVSHSSSRSINETVDGSHNFLIQGYSLAKGIGAGKYLSSDTFSVGGYDWAIYFYPDGKNPEDNSMYVSVFIALAGDGKDVRALFELTLLDQSGKGKHKIHSHFDRALESGPYSLKYNGSMWGYKRFFRRTLLESSDFIKDDCLSMRCTVGVVRTRVQGPKPARIPIPPSKIGQDFKGLLETEVGCDIAFQVGEENFKAHKLILAARSSVFLSQFFGQFGDGNMEKVVMEEVEPSIFKAMLIYIYSDKLPEIHEITGSTSLSTSTNMVQHLLAAAERFNLDRLKVLCEAKLCEKVDIDTVATTLALAEQYHCLQLRSICLKFAADPFHLGAVMQSDGYKHLESTNPGLISEILRSFAEVEESPRLSRKRSHSSSSSLLGLDLKEDGGVTESGNATGRRTRRRAA